MARTLHRLTNLDVARKKKPGMYADGAGLYLRVAPGGSKQFVFRYVTNGRMRDMGIGPTHTLSLATARERAREARALRLEGIDPIASKRERKAALRATEAKQITFKQCCAEYLRAADSKWTNRTHREQWRDTLAMLYPVLGELPVNTIDKALVIKALDPIWTRTPVTGSRLRGRLEAVLAWATVRDLRSGDNPATWDLLKHAGFKGPTRANHHAALPYPRIGEFMATLRKSDSVTAHCLEFLILTAARAGEVTGATWDEVDRASRTWTVPASRMKGGREHRVPLSDAAIAALDRMPRGTGLIFGLHNSTIRAVVARIAGTEATVHGFRSTFRTWADEQTSYPHHVVEQALAHSIGSAVERAYRRGDLFEKRRRLMDEWARYCGKSSAGKVVSIRRAT